MLRLPFGGHGIPRKRLKVGPLGWFPHTFIYIHSVLYTPTYSTVLYVCTVRYVGTYMLCCTVLYVPMYI